MKRKLDEERKKKEEEERIKIENQRKKMELLRLKNEKTFLFIQNNEFVFTKTVGKGNTTSIQKFDLIFSKDGTTFTFTSTITEKIDEKEISTNSFLSLGLYFFLKLGIFIFKNKR
jgi:hypothetical protein